jgi:hypothetical protein
MAMLIRFTGLPDGHGGEPGCSSNSGLEDLGLLAYCPMLSLSMAELQGVSVFNRDQPELGIR